MEGRTPAYYTDAGLSVRYRTGQVAPYVSWSAGYRLPTEAEWEKAARGGALGHRFPWSDANTINWSRANYYASLGSYSYDVNPTSGYNPAWTSGGYSYTTPVGSFAANGYGLYDMAGNVFEWCWDWYSSTYYSPSPRSDPRGPASISFRVLRGGSWSFNAIDCRTASRNNIEPEYSYSGIGFRTVLPPSQ
jgi:formylglycine-generating enzyme required for sulfatase activity